LVLRVRIPYGKSEKSASVNTIKILYTITLALQIHYDIYAFLETKTVGYLRNKDVLKEKDKEPFGGGSAQVVFFFFLTGFVLSHFLENQLFADLDPEPEFLNF
jgi:hypothetical protein